MSLAQVKATVNALLTQIDGQNRLIQAFKTANDDNIALVQSALQGSTGGHDQAMLTALSRSGESLSKAQQALKQAQQAANRLNSL